MLGKKESQTAGHKGLRAALRAASRDPASRDPTSRDPASHDPASRAALRAPGQIRAQWKTKGHRHSAMLGTRGSQTADQQDLEVPLRELSPSLETWKLEAHWGKRGNGHDKIQKEMQTAGQMDLEATMMESSSSRAACSLEAEFERRGKIMLGKKESLTAGQKGLEVPLLESSSSLATCTNKAVHG